MQVCWCVRSGGGEGEREGGEGVREGELGGEGGRERERERERKVWLSRLELRGTCNLMDLHSSRLHFRDHKFHVQYHILCSRYCTYTYMYILRSTCKVLHVRAHVCRNRGV